MAGGLARWHARCWDGWGKRLVGWWGLGCKITSCSTRDFLVETFRNIIKATRRTDGENYQHGQLVALGNTLYLYKAGGCPPSPPPHSPHQGW